jgi:amidase
VSGKQNGRNRRNFIRTGLFVGAGAVGLPVLHAPGQSGCPPATDVAAFELDEITISQLADGMSSGKYTARAIAEKYLARIEAIDRHGPALNSVIEINPDALEIAEKLDAERKEKGARGPLHGIPILLKDNLDTADKMMTTAGSLALVGSKPSKDSFVVQRLRAAGAVILGKTNLSEWANIRSTHSTSGWSGRGGQTKNPFALDRNPCGSSSGSGAAVSANLCVAAIGTETDGSIVCPANANGVVGIKPTVGLTSRTGIIPISHTQDGAGPLARTVRDAAIVLATMVGVDAEDAASSLSQGKGLNDYTKFLDPKGLNGARIGVVRKYFGFSDSVDRLMEGSLSVLKSQGAVLVDPVEIETLGKFDESEFTVFLYELKTNLNKYLERLGPSAPVKNLREVIAFNEKNRDKEMPFFGQDIFVHSEAKGPLSEKEYVDALAKNRLLARAEGIDAVMDKHKLDALVAPTGNPAWPTDLVNGDHSGGGSSNAAAVAGYPNINVPAGNLWGLPVGLSFFGRAWSEPTLIRLAYAFEQATKARITPKFLPTVKA